VLELKSSIPSRSLEVVAVTTAGSPPLPWLERANRLALIARLLDDTVHEANNALQVISGQAELIGMGAVDQVARERAGNIGRKARSTSLMLQDLLTFAQDATQRKERFTLSSIAGDALAMRRYSLTRLRIDVHVQPDAGDVWVLGSRRVLLQIVLNLVLNAEQALAGMPSATLRLHTCRCGDTIELTVEDCGPGLPETRAPWSPDTLIGSDQLGIGVGVVEWLAGRQGGQLRWARAEGGLGCRATLSLPAAS
jgi:two-component system, LuxR family, sensor kinase FixL